MMVYIFLVSCKFDIVVVYSRLPLVVLDMCIVKPNSCHCIVCGLYTSTKLSKKFRSILYIYRIAQNCLRTLTFAFFEDECWSMKLMYCMV
jgi:hypothetical protein